MSELKKVAAEMKLSLSEEKNLGFIESIAKTNTDKITREILEGLSEDTGESDNYDADSGGEDSEGRHGNQAIQSSENQLLDKVTLKT